MKDPFVSRRPVDFRASYFWVFLRQFYTPLVTGGLHNRLIDCESPHVSKTLLSILAVLKNAVDWIILILSRTSSSFNLSSRFFRLVPRAPAVIGTTVTNTFYNFFVFDLWQSRGIHIIFRFPSFNWWLFIEFWATESFLNSPGLF